MSLPNRVTCKVPGSTSNCGSGFDTLGLALSIYNDVTVERSSSAPDESLGEDIAPESDMGRETVNRFFREAGVEPFAVRIRIRGSVPKARGLGSSVTVRGGILAGLAALAQLEWDKERLVSIITDLEGHPDNASASILGGFTVSRFISDPARVESVQQFDVEPELRFVVAAPEFEVLTSAARGVLPKSLSFGETIASINSASNVVAALASGRYESLAASVGDFVHEPFRLSGIPGARQAIAEGIRCGAYTGWLSGSGSSVLCACPVDTAAAAGRAMQAAFRAAGLESAIYDLAADNEGLRVVSID